LAWLYSVPPYLLARVVETFGTPNVEGRSFFLFFYHCLLQRAQRVRFAFFSFLLSALDFFCGYAMMDMLGYVF